MDQNNQDNQFIPKKEDSGVNTLFEELGSELNFGDSETLSPIASTGKKHPLEWTSIVTGVIVKLLIVGGVITGIDTTIRNLESSELIKNLPLCSYYSYGVSDYENTECATYSEISTKISSEKSALEEELAVNLAILVPQKLLIQNTLKSPEIQYILAKTASNRAPINEMLAKFSEYRTSATVYKGEDIECGNFVVNENGDITVSCDFYGFSLNGSSTGKVLTSRNTATAFLDKLRSPESTFKILNEPKALEIGVYSSTDLGIKSTFTTKTTINLKLRYSAPNRI